MAGDPTPLSTALGLPILAKTRLPFEGTFGIPSLTGPRWFMTGSLGFGRANLAPLSSALGLATLSSNPTPLSSLFGLPTHTTRRKTAA